MCSPSVYAPGTSPVPYVSACTVMPRSRACASVSPTAHTCGLVKVTRGTAWALARSRESFPRIWSAATRAWYLPMCVSGASPLQSPIANSQPPSTLATRNV